LVATGAEEAVVPASEYRALQGQVRELQRLLGKKTMETEILKETLEVSAGSKKHLLRSLSWPKDGSQ
jgi:transposase